MIDTQYAFLICNKIVLFSADKQSVLLCRRVGEADFDAVYSLIGGKMEISDQDLAASMGREKAEEIGSACQIRIYTDYAINIEYQKNDGTKMLLPHYYAVFEQGEIQLNEEYDQFVWVPLNELADFEPKVPNISDVAFSLQQIEVEITAGQSVVV